MSDTKETIEIYSQLLQKYKDLNPRQILKEVLELEFKLSMNLKKINNELNKGCCDWGLIKNTVKATLKELGIK